MFGIVSDTSRAMRKIRRSLIVSILCFNSLWRHQIEISNGIDCACTLQAACVRHWELSRCRKLVKIRHATQIWCRKSRSEVLKATPKCQPWKGCVVIVYTLPKNYPHDWIWGGEGWIVCPCEAFMGQSPPWGTFHRKNYNEGRSRNSLPSIVTYKSAFQRGHGQRAALAIALLQSWALDVSLNFFNNKKFFFFIFYQVSNLFFHQSYIKSPLSVKLTW